MGVGTAFYAYIVGNTIGIINDADNQSCVLEIKLSTLAAYSRQYNLPMHLRDRIENYVRKDLSDQTSVRS
jgi:hypothetical protein